MRLGRLVTPLARRVAVAAGGLGAVHSYSQLYRSSAAEGGGLLAPPPPKSKTIHEVKLSVSTEVEAAFAGMTPHTPRRTRAPCRRSSRRAALGRLGLGSGSGLGSSSAWSRRPSQVSAHTEARARLRLVHSARTVHTRLAWRLSRSPRQTACTAPAPLRAARPPACCARRCPGLPS